MKPFAYLCYFDIYTPARSTLYTVSRGFTARASPAGVCALHSQNKLISSVELAHVERLENLFSLRVTDTYQFWNDGNEESRRHAVAGELGGEGREQHEHDLRLQGRHEGQPKHSGYNDLQESRALWGKRCCTTAEQRATVSHTIMTSRLKTHKTNSVQS